MNNIPRFLKNLCATLLLACTTAQAASFTVNTTTDLTDAVPGDGVCEATPAGGDCTVRAAIMETNELAGADTITIPAGTYTLTIDGTDGAAALGDLNIVSSEVVINGAGAGVTLLDAGGIDRYFSTFAANVMITDLTIQNGVTDADASVGGAINVNPGVIDPNNLLLSRVHLLNNGAKLGGAVRAATDAMVLIEDSLLQGNVTIEAGVGNRTAAAIYCQGCNLTLDSSTVTGNGDDLSGKVIEVDGNGQINIINSTISGNLFGGGIRATNGNVTILFSTIADNTAQNLSFFSFDDSHVFEVGNSVLQTSTHDNCQTGDLPTSLGYNVVNDATCEFTATGDLQNTDALLAALADNGGPTQTRLPGASSPAIDRVPLAACNDLNDVPLADDQRGVERPSGAQCDSGAVEVSAPLDFADGFEDLP